jgi:hypothetical protein
MSTLRCTNLQDTSGGNSLTTAQIYNGAAKAWVSFNSLGTVSIYAQHNVSSITDNGIGDFTLNFTSAFSNTNYATVFGNMTDYVFDGRYLPNIKYNTRATGSVGIVIKYAGNGSSYDCDYTSVSIFR